MANHMISLITRSTTDVMKSLFLRFSFIFYESPMVHVYISFCFQLMINILIIFFQTRIPFIKKYKNPCWYDKPNHLSCLPYFIILGVQKCGTTDLFASFVHHPDFRPSLCKNGNECKELHFFDSEYYYAKTGKYIFKYLVHPRFWMESAVLIFLVFCVVIFILFVFDLCLVYPMLLASLDCLFLIAPSVFSKVHFVAYLY